MKSSLKPYTLSVAELADTMQALRVLASQAQALGDVPVGAMILDAQGKTMAQGYNTREHQHHPLGHAECEVLYQAAQALGTWRLSGCTLLVTLEPCPMCLSAILQARVSQLVFGAWDAQGGAFSLGVHTLLPEIHRLTWLGGIEEEACRQQLLEFFKHCRHKIGSEAL
ncbi:MAG: nucleoside deaminase [Vampirovibrionales bacterium]